MFDVTKMIFCFPSPVLEKAEFVHFKKLYPKMTDVPWAKIKIKVINERNRRLRIAKHGPARKRP